MNEKPAIVIGAGGHCRTIISILESCKKKIHGILDKAKEQDDHVLSVPIIGERSTYLRYIDQCDFYIALGDNRERKDYYNAIQLKGGSLPKLIHPLAKIDSSSVIGNGTIISSSAIVCPEVELGDNCIVNTRALVEHNVKIDNHVHLAPDTSIAGKVKVDEGAFVGLKSSVNDGVQIGRWAVVGAGSVVVNDVPEFSTMVGNPAQIVAIKEEYSGQNFGLALIENNQSIKKTMETIDYFGRGYVIVTNEKNEATIYFAR